MSIKYTAWETQSSEETLHKLLSSEDGLTDAMVLKRQQEDGLNKLPDQKKVFWWHIAFSQFMSPLIIILFLAAIVSGFFGEWVDALVIFAAILLNAGVGFIQEYKANQSLEQIRSLVQPYVLVMREGKKREIPAQDLVVGDILFLQQGDQVGADARLLDAVDLEMNEASLTGEPIPVKKNISSVAADTALAERLCMVYAGTTVLSGRGKAMVVATGIHTEIGQIAHLMLITEEEATPLQKELKRLAKGIAITVMMLILFLFFLGLLTGQEIFEMFEISVALAVAAIPEGLALSITIILAIGMQRILKRGSLVRKLVAAETLGSVSVLCTDKTGTLTEGMMRATEIIRADSLESISLQTENVSLPTWSLEMLEIGMLCNNASVQETQEVQEPLFRGNATECALMEIGLQKGFSYTSVQNHYPRLAEIPFDSARKYMVTSHTWSGGTYRLLLKGAPEKIISFCGFFVEQGEKKILDDIHRQRLQESVETFTSQGLRLIAVAYKESNQEPKMLSPEEEGNFVLLGFITLRDPLRADAKEEIQRIKGAGIRPVIITGDHPKTAMAIALEAGLTTFSERVVTGEIMDGWSEAELKKHIEHIDIYARVEPKHKLRIIDAWQAHGAVVAMTGDGVNDAPALKSADIGIALGSGTDVAKQASDLILLDNRLGTISAAIEQGRVMFDNMRKTIAYLMIDSFAEIVLIAGALFLGLPLPLLPVQILWINLVADSLPNAGLAFEPGEPDIMKLAPRPRHERMMNRQMLFLVFAIGLITDLILFFVYLWLLSVDSDISHVRAVLFAAVGIDSLIYIFAVKQLRQSLFASNPFSNRWLLGGVVIGFALMAVVFVFEPLRVLFEIAPLRLSDGWLLLIIAIGEILLIEITKRLLFFSRKPSSVYSS